MNTSAPTRALLPLAIAAALTASVTGCATTIESQNIDRVATATKEMHTLLPAEKPAVAPPAAEIKDSQTPALNIKPLDPEKQLQKERQWLRSKRITYTPSCRKDGRCNSVGINEILKEFRAAGLNIMTSLPVDGYTYSGNGVKDVDAETALDLILGSMGLDFDTNERGQYVTIIPMRSQSWNLNLGNRSSGFLAASFADSCPSMTGSTSQATTGGGGTATGTSTATPTAQPTSGQSGQPGGGAQPGQANGGGNSGGIQTATVSRTNLQTSNSVWRALDAELTQRMTILVPNNSPANGITTANGQTNVPGINNPNVAYAGAGNTQSSTSGNTFFRRETIGAYTLNPETGAITIQAPAWLLRQLDKYINSVIAMYNTSLTFEGIIANVKSSSDRSEGFDLNAFGTYANRFGFTLQNNILGGISLSSSNGIPTATAGNSGSLPGGGASFGLGSAKDNLQLFNAFLSTIGGADNVTKPIITVTSGVPVDFGRLTPIYTNEQSQQLSAGNINANATVTIVNNVIEHRYGSVLRIMPYYDANQRRVRAQISLLQRPLVGYQNINIGMTDAKGNIINQPIQKPQIECSVTTTEAILDDGEMIVIGGQVENIANNNHAGVTGAMDIKMLDLFTSQKRTTETKTTTYFALRVRLTEKPAH